MFHRGVCKGKQAEIAAKRKQLAEDKQVAESESEEHGATDTSIPGREASPGAPSTATVLVAIGNVEVDQMENRLG